jgi:probable DNA repair protein
VFSHALRESGLNANEQAREASALIRGIPLSAVADVIPALSQPDFAAALQANGNRELIPDRDFAALPAPTTVHGGASVIRDQAACPFRSFARHRLLARSLDVPNAGLDAAERGTLLHRVLSLVWGRIGSHAGLLLLNGDLLDEVAHVAVAQAIAEARTNGADSLIGRFAEIEHTRLTRVIRDWLDYERDRAPFEVVERERKRVVSISGLSMNLRLDRLDRLADGTHALIDYKTGVAKFSSWLGNRPDEPQLPLYFVTADEPISALAFARLKRGERGKVFGFEGVSVVENLLPDVAPIEQKRGMEKSGYLSWDVLVEEWETSLDALAKGFAAGAAQVDPKNGSLTCVQCDLQSVCRIAEVSSYAAMEVGVSADPDGRERDESTPDE